MASRCRHCCRTARICRSNLTLTKADYDSEPATRISIPARNRKDHDLELQLADAVKNDASTRFLQQRYLSRRCASVAPIT